MRADYEIDISPFESGADALVAAAACRGPGGAVRARRSCLTVPATSEKMLAKAVGLAADVELLDLEDAVAPAEKTDEACAGVVAALRDGRWAAPAIAVRVNAPSTRWCFRDLVAVVEGAGSRVGFVVVPKVESAGHVQFLDLLLTQLEEELGLGRRIGLELQIESAAGLVAIEQIAAASSRTEALIFSHGDFAASLGVPQLTVGAVDREYPGDQWHYVLMRVVTTARAFGLQAIDGPFAAVRDIAGLREAARRSQLLGFDGKWAIHPDQIEFCNEVYTPSAERVERAEGGYDHTVQGLAGWMELTGGPQQPPMKSGLSLVDFCAGYVAALATVAGVWQARCDGRGCDADVSLFETALAQLTCLGVWVASQGFEPRRMADSAHQTMVPFQAFPTADGWIMVACPKQRLWVRSCDTIDRPELPGDPRFADFAARDRNRDTLVPLLAEVLSGRTTAEWLERLGAHGVLSAPVNDVRSALRDVHAAARGDVVSYEHPVLGGVRGPTSPFRLNGAPPVARRGPLLGEHTHEVLRDLCGYDDERLSQLPVAGVFGARDAMEDE